MAVTNINEVLAVLDATIQQSIKNKSRVGYFAALYYKVTYRVKQGIANGEFEDGPRMEALDVCFANRYLDALAGWQQNQPITASWQAAFEATEKPGVLLLQHLLLGINAHINLDLGIAAAMVAQGHLLAAVKKDFAAINNIIASLTYEVLNDISRVSPLLSLLGLHATNYVSVLVQFSIGNARDGAWSFAEDLTTTDGAVFTQMVQGRDKTIAQLGNELARVKGFMRFTCWVIHVFEWRNPASITALLHGYTKKYFSYSQ